MAGDPCLSQGRICLKQHLSTATIVVLVQKTATALYRATGNISRVVIGRWNFQKTARILLQMPSDKQRLHRLALCARPNLQLQLSRRRVCVLRALGLSVHLSSFVFAPTSRAPGNFVFGFLTTHGCNWGWWMQSLRLDDCFAYVLMHIVAIGLSARPMGLREILQLACKLQVMLHLITVSNECSSRFLRACLFNSSSSFVKF